MKTSLRERCSLLRKTELFYASLRITEFFGRNPVRYLTDDTWLDYVCVQDLRDACDLTMIEHPSNKTIN